MALAHPIPVPAARFLLQPLTGGRVRDIALVLGATGFLALMAQVAMPVPGSPVPVTGQTLAVLVVGATLGTVRGVSSMVLYLVIGMLGVPVFSDASGGVHVVFGATGGYLVGFVLAAAAMGWAAARGWDRTPLRAFPLFLLGQGIIFAVALPWLAVVAGLGLAETIAAGLLPFIVGGLVKSAIASALLPGAWRLAGRQS
ncbi:MAG TPA: biotin transporter BioY [Jiangellaceae bacterium]|nr:biotin transporter BioY [Jiangellaceae bacterium]